MIPFPPLPAVVLLPFVAVLGLAVDQVLLAVVIGALDVAVAFWVLGRLGVRPAVRLLLTLFVGAGAVPLVRGVDRLDLVLRPRRRGRPGARRGRPRARRRATRRRARRGRDRARREPLLDGRQLAAGFLLGLAATSRLTVAFGFPFLLLVGGGGWRRRGASAAIGMAIPILGLLAYNLAATGSPFSPVYEALYRYEVLAYPDLGYNAAWSLQDVRYIPQNLGVMLFSLPTLMPPCDPGVARLPWSATGCSWAVPQQTGMSLLLTSPAWLLALPSLALLRDRRVAGALARDAGDRGRQPGALQPGLGPVRVSLQPRLRPLPPRRRRPRGGALPGIPRARAVAAASPSWAASWPSPSRSRRGGSPGPGRSAGEPARDAPSALVGGGGARARRRRRLRPRPRACSSPARASGTPGSSRPCRRLLGTAHPDRLSRATCSWAGSRRSSWRRSASPPCG